MELSTLGTLIAGWLFGVLSPGLIARVERPKRKKELASCKAKELADIRYKVALIPIGVRTDSRTMDAGTLKLVRRVISDTSTTIDDTKIADGLQHLLGDDEGPALAILNAGPPKEVGSWFPPYHAPFLQAHLAEVMLFNPSEQSRLLRALAELDLYDNQVDYVRLLLGRSFTLTGVNHEINKESARSATMHQGTRAESLIVAINSAIGEPGEKL